MHKALGLLVCSLAGVSAFQTVPVALLPTARLSSARLGAPVLRARGGAQGVAALRSSVQVEKDVDAVGVALCGYVKDAAAKAIKERGYFALAIPGGSILKMLAFMDTSSVDWSKTIMAYVNHRAVPNDDETATHLKAGPLFLNEWQKAGCNDGQRHTLPPKSYNTINYITIYIQNLRKCTYENIRDTLSLIILYRMICFLPILVWHL